MNSKKKGMSLIAKQRAAGWTFLAPASILIAIMSFYPMVRAFIISLQKGTGANMRFTGFSNYQRILVDKVFQQSIGNTFFLPDYPGANHAYTCNSAGTVIKQQTFKIAGIVPNLCLPPMCDFTGFLFVDLPFDVCNRRTD